MLLYVLLLNYGCAHQCVLFLTLFCIYGVFFYSLFRNERFIFLFFFFPSYVQSAYLLYFLQSFCILPRARVSKYCFSDSNRPSTLGKQLKRKSRCHACGIRFIKTLIFLEMKFYFTLFALRINMECSSSCISCFFAVRPKCLKFPRRLKSCEDKRGISAVLQRSWVILQRQARAWKF